MSEHFLCSFCLGTGKTVGNQICPRCRGTGKTGDIFDYLVEEDRQERQRNERYNRDHGYHDKERTPD
jgi:hypothetical protein